MMLPKKSLFTVLTLGLTLGTPALAMEGYGKKHELVMNYLNYQLGETQKASICKKATDKFHEAIEGNVSTVNAELAKITKVNDVYATQDEARKKYLVHLSANLHFFKKLLPASTKGDEFHEAPPEDPTDFDEIFHSHHRDLIQDAIIEATKEAALTLDHPKNFRFENVIEGDQVIGVRVTYDRHSYGIENPPKWLSSMIPSVPSPTVLITAEEISVSQTIDGRKMEKGLNLKEPAFVDRSEAPPAITALEDPSKHQHLIEDSCPAAKVAQIMEKAQAEHAVTQSKYRVTTSRLGGE